MLLKKFFRMQRPEGAEGSAGGAPDRGDNFEPTGNDTPPEKILPDAAADAAAAELAAQLEAAAEAAAAEADKDKDDDKKGDKKDTRIPLSRHKEILEKERAARTELETKLAQYQAGNQLADVNAEITAAENNIITMEKEYGQLLTDGEIEKAAALMQKIRTTERQMAEAKSDMKIHAAEIRATERARYNTALERVELAFPTLNPDHADYDEDAMAEVADLKSAYEMKGLTPTAALQKAVKMIVEPRTTKQEMATNTKPNVSEKDVAAARKEAAVDKVVKATAKTPPSLARVGLDGDKLGGGKLDPKSVLNMSQKEFASLNEETLAQMRGDEL
jgi:hypothetical protein